MAKEYDCRAYCMNMQQKVIEGKYPEIEPPHTKGALGYYCSLTNGRCVGAKYGIAIWSNDRIDLKIVRRCPSRQTIDDVVQKK